MMGLLCFTTVCMYVQEWFVFADTQSAATLFIPATACHPLSCFQRTMVYDWCVGRQVLSRKVSSCTSQRWLTTVYVVVSLLPCEAPSCVLGSKCLW
jgi:hypothetical protein